jgi:hypothetical protein
MSFARLWASLAILLPALAALIANLSSVDLAYHLRAGGDILAGGGIPRQDAWTFTALGQPWLDQQWGAQVILSATYQLLGWTGLVLLRAALVGLLFGLVFLAARLRGADLRRAAALSLAAFVVSAVALALRPQLFGMVLLALVLVILAVRRRRPAAMWAIPVVVAAWANLHGSFFLGPVVVGLAWLEDVADRDPQARRTILVAVVAALASLLNPFGPGVWLYAAGLSTNAEVTARITEWQPTTLRTVPGLLFFGSALAVAVLLARRGTRTSWPTLAWLAVFFVIGAYAIRGVAWWPVGAAFAVAPLVARPEPVERPLARWQRRFHAAIAGAIVVVGVVLLPVWRPIDPGLQAPSGVVGNAPPGITAALREQARAGDRLLNPQPWGSWFEFSFPAMLVAIDSRIEVFPPEVWDDYETVTEGRDGWQAIVERWGVTLVVVPDGEDAYRDRLVDDGWQVTHEDDDGFVLRRGP